MPSKGKGLPSVCASMITFVFFVIARSIDSHVGFLVPGSTSTNTGTHRFWMIGLTVVGKAHAAAITSSPGLIALLPKTDDVRAVSANRLAEDPEFTSDTYRTPRYEEKSFSNCFANSKTSADFGVGPRNFWI